MHDLLDPNITNSLIRDTAVHSPIVNTEGRGVVSVGYVCCCSAVNCLFDDIFFCDVCAVTVGGLTVTEVLDNVNVHSFRFVMLVVGGECHSASAAPLIHRLGANSAKRLREYVHHVHTVFENEKLRHREEHSASVVLS